MKMFRIAEESLGGADGCGFSYLRWAESLAITVPREDLQRYDMTLGSSKQNEANAPSEGDSREPGFQERKQNKCRGKMQAMGGLWAIFDVACRRRGAGAKI
jgi:hypothetical protein